MRLRLAYRAITGPRTSRQPPKDRLPEQPVEPVDGVLPRTRVAQVRAAHHNIAPVTEVEACEAPRSDPSDTFSRSPRLAIAALRPVSRDEAMVVEYLINLGRRDARHRTARFVLELGARLMLVGLGTGAGHDCPLSHYRRADALGLRAVHINRVLRILRENGLRTFRDGAVVFHEFGALAALAGFDPNYLDQGGPPLRSLRLRDLLFTFVPNTCPLGEKTTMLAR